MIINRSLCDVLEEMRNCCTTLNFSYLSGLIEEAQSMGNRMEAKLADIRDYKQLVEDKQKLYKEIKELKKEKK